MLKKFILVIVAGVVLVAIFGEDKLEAETSLIPSKTAQAKSNKINKATITSAELEKAAHYLTKMSKVSIEENILETCPNTRTDSTCRDKILSKHNLNYDTWLNYLNNVYIKNIDKFKRGKQKNGSEIFSLK